MNYKDIPFEVKELGETGQFSGYAAAFHNEDLGGDIIMPGAFTKTIADNATRTLLWSHNQEKPIGVTTVHEDTKGLVVDGRLNMDVMQAREAHSLMKQGAIKGLSVGYTVVGKDWRGATRVIKEMKLHEVSLVSIPMNPHAQVISIKSLDDFEQMLRNLIEYKVSDGEMSAEYKALIVELAKKLSSLGADGSSLQADTHDTIAPEVLHAGLDQLQKFLRGEN